MTGPDGPCEVAPVGKRADWRYGVRIEVTPLPAVVARTLCHRCGAADRPPVAVYVSGLEAEIAALQARVEGLSDWAAIAAENAELRARLAEVTGRAA